MTSGSIGLACLSRWLPGAAVSYGESIYRTSGGAPEADSSYRYDPEGDTWSRLREPATGA